MTEHDTTPEGKLRAGDWISFTRSTSAWGDIHGRGTSVQLTPDLIARSVNMEGRSWLDSVDDEGARIQRGQWPAGAPTWVYGSTDWEVARGAANRAAHALQNASERAAALQRVREEFGPGPSSNRTVQGPSDPELRRQAAKEHARRAAEVPKPKPRNLDREMALADLMEAGKAAAFTRTLEAREILGEVG